MFFRLILLALLTLTAARAQQLPTLHGTTLSDHPITLPADISGKPFVLIFGFSKDAGLQSHDWTTRLHAGVAPTLPVYTVAMLEAVPRFLRATVVRSITRGMPVTARDVTISVFAGESDWKRLLHFNRSTDAYVVLVDATGQIRATYEGAPEASFAQMQKQLSSLAPTLPAPAR